MDSLITTVNKLESVDKKEVFGKHEHFEVVVCLFENHVRIKVAMFIIVDYKTIYWVRSLEEILCKKPICVSYTIKFKNKKVLVGVTL